MRVILVALLVLSLCAVPLRAATLTPEQVAGYTAQLQGDDEKRCQQAAHQLAVDQQVAVLLAALKANKASRRTVIIDALPACLTPAVVDALLELLAHDADARVRNAALAVLDTASAREEMKDRHSALQEAFKAAANDSDGFIARDAVNALAKTSPDHIDLLLEVLANAHNNLARAQAAWVIKDAKDPRVYAVLVKAMSDQDAEVSSRAAAALGKLGDARAAPLLLRVLQQDFTAPQLFTATGQALAELKAPEVLDPLFELVKTGTPNCREAALVALGGYHDARVGQLMLSVLDDPSPTTRADAAHILAVQPYAPAANALLAQAAKEQSTLVRGELLHALAALGEARAREFFAAVLTAPDQYLRTAGVQGLLVLHDARALDSLNTMLQTSDSFEVAAAIRLLGDSGNPQAIEPLLQYSQRRNEQHPGAGWNSLQDDAIRKLTGGDIRSMVLESGNNRAAPVTIGILLIGTQREYHGEFLDALVTLYNRSRQAVVIQELCPTYDGSEEPIVLSGAVRGEVSAQPGGYRFDGKSSQPSAIPLHAGLLLPGQAMQVKVLWRPISMNERFLVRYLVAEQPYDGTPASLAPLTVFIPDPAQAATSGPRTFVPFTDAGWRTVCQPMPLATPTGPSAPARAVVITAGPDVQPREEAMMAYPRVADRDFPLFDHARRTAAHITQKTSEQLAMGYSQALNGFVVADGDDCWLLTDLAQQAKGEALPSFPLLLLKDVDLGKVSVQLDAQLLGTEQKLWGTYPALPGTGTAANSACVTVDAATLPAFLAAVLAHYGSLTVQQGPYHARTYVLKLAAG